MKIIYKKKKKKKKKKKSSENTTKTMNLNVREDNMYN